MCSTEERCSSRPSEGRDLHEEQDPLPVLLRLGRQQLVEQHDVLVVEVAVAERLLDARDLLLGVPAPLHHVDDDALLVGVDVTVLDRADDGVAQPDDARAVIT
jgi:hypothetical protein